MKRRFLLKGLLALGGLGAISALGWHHRWKYIVIHHSAGNFGNIPFLQEVHRQRQADDPIDAIPYHYIIGNGNGMKVGEIASDWRQEYGIWGAHVSHNNPDKNMRGIGICLIGNLEKKPMPQGQYEALVALVHSLMQKYSIDVENVNGHGHIHGESTLCPGHHFPMVQLKRDLRRLQQV